METLSFTEVQQKNAQLTADFIQKFKEWYAQGARNPQAEKEAADRLLKSGNVIIVPQQLSELKIKAYQDLTNIEAKFPVIITTINKQRRELSKGMTYNVHSCVVKPDEKNKPEWWDQLLGTAPSFSIPMPETELNRFEENDDLGKQSKIVMVAFRDTGLEYPITNGNGDICDFAHYVAPRPNLQYAQKVYTRKELQRELNAHRLDNVSKMQAWFEEQEMMTEERVLTQLKEKIENNRYVVNSVLVDERAARLGMVASAEELAARNASLGDAFADDDDDDGGQVNEPVNADASTGGN
jgi:hypothetical protein